jgi:hypothetical protein
MAPVSACRPAMSGSVPATPAGAAAPAASAPAAASLGSSVSVLATYHHHHHTTQQQQKKNQIKTPNGGPGPILPRAHGGGEIRTFARFAGCATAATPSPAPAAWSVGAGDELFSPSSSCCAAGRLAAALRLVSTMSQRRGEREGDAKRRDETKGSGEENKTEGFVLGLPSCIARQKAE